jgi:hypothetical protein
MRVFIVRTDNSGVFTADGKDSAVKNKCTGFQVSW